MKVYNLSCKQGHRFEGWFSSEDDFNAQLHSQRLECPMCSSGAVTRTPSAPRLNLSGADTLRPDPEYAFQAKLLEFARKVIANTDDVGSSFAEEARRIHYQETPQRGIRGTATSEEFIELADEGIDVVPFSLPDSLKHGLQ